MRRRYKALIAIIVPIILVYGLKYTHEASYQWLMGYMLAVVLVFKSSIASLWLASQLNIIAFLKSLTLFQGIILIIKRWLLDSVLFTWIQTHIIDNLIEGLKEVKNFYFRLNLKAQLKNIFILFFGTFFTIFILYFTGLLDNILLFTELRLFIAGVFKVILTFIAKVLTWSVSWFAVSWLAPIVEVFALSYLLIHLEKWFGPNNIVSRFFNFIGDKINLLLYYVGLLNEKHIHPMIVQPIVSKSKQVNKQLTSMIHKKKIREEFRYFEIFENIIMQGHIDAYHSFKGMEDITDKQSLYTLINQKTKDNIDIVAYVSRDDAGELLDESVADSFYHDIFLLESFASHKEHGVKVYDEPLDQQHINHNDFWVMNTSKYPVTIGSIKKHFSPIIIPPHGLKLIKIYVPFYYKDRDVYCEYNEIKVCVTPIERVL